jgi:hypothetical protein
LLKKKKGVLKLTEDEYAIVSKKEFMALKKELERIKKNPLEGSESGEDLQSSIDNLNKSLNVMLEVFKQAAEDMKLEEHESETVAKQIGPITDKIDMLIDQNQKIAKGIVAVADMVKEKLEEMEEKSEAKPKLPPLGGGPKPFAPKPAPMAPPMPGPAPGPGAELPPLGAPEGLESPGALPPLTPPGAPPPPGAVPPPPGPAPPGEKKNIMGGLMK